MKLIEHYKNAHELEIKARELFTFQASDIHFDSKYCDRKLLKKHLDICKANNGLAFFYGDIFDVMGCYKDPRSKYSDIRSEYLTGKTSYLDAVVTDAFEFFEPYKDIIAFMSLGNHETAIIKHRDTNILDRLAFMLRQAGGVTLSGAYSGYFRIKFKMSKEGNHRSIITAYHHGAGGTAQRSKGILHSQMDSLVWSDADIFYSGHTHERLYDTNIVYGLNRSNSIVRKKRIWCKTGTYKVKEGEDLGHGWEVEKKFMPKPVGGYFVKYGFVDTTDKETNARIIKNIIDITEAN